MTNAIPPLARPIELAIPQFTTFMVGNLVLVAVTAAVLLWIILPQPRRLWRPALLLALFTHLLYQWPLVLLSGPIDASLEHPWQFAGMVHAVVAGMVAWSIVSRRFDPAPVDTAQPRLHWTDVALPLLALAGLSAVYLARVPAECTALYSLVMDPHLTLLAREFSIKLVGSSMATYSFGAVANAVAPVALAASLFFVWQGLRGRKVLQAILFAVAGFASVALVLLSGTKGLLVPSMIMLVATSFLWNRSWWLRTVAAIAALGFLGGSVVLFDVVKERDAEAGSNYDFAACSVRLNTCPASLDLMDSLSKRDMSLGLPMSLVKRLDERLICACNPELKGQCKRVQPVRIFRSRRPPPEGEQQESVLEEQVKRGFTVMEAIINRAFVIPAQVAGWHAMYVETEPNPGMAAMPFARRLLDGFSLNAPELVYQKYGVIYSDGDRTKTSTAPTGFLMAYPAYLGAYGLLMALGLVIIFDVIATALLRRLPRAIVPFAVGLLAAVCLNFAVSDYVTVLISHGGAAALALMAAYLGLGKVRAWRADAATKAQA